MSGKRRRENDDTEVASILPFARFAVPRRTYRLALTLPPNCVLVSSSTYRQLQWGRGGHCEILRTGARSISKKVASAWVCGQDTLDLGDAVSEFGLRDEWEVHLVELAETVERRVELPIIC